MRAAVRWTSCWCCCSVLFVRDGSYSRLLPPAIERRVEISGFEDDVGLRSRWGCLQCNTLAYLRKGTSENGEVSVASVTAVPAFGRVSLSLDQRSVWRRSNPHNHSFVSTLAGRGCGVSPQPLPACCHRSVGCIGCNEAALDRQHHGGYLGRPLGQLDGRVADSTWN